MHISKWIKRAEQVWTQAIYYGWSFQDIVDADPGLFQNWPWAVVHLQAGAPCPPGIKPTKNMAYLLILQKKHRKVLNSFEILSLAYEELQHMLMLASQGLLHVGPNKEAAELLHTPKIKAALPFLKIGGHHYPRKPYYLVHLALKFHICYYAALTMFCKLLTKSVKLSC